MHDPARRSTPRTSANVEPGERARKARSPPRARSARRAGPRPTARRDGAGSARCRCRARRASAVACSGPAPPSATSVKRRGSRPRRIETSRMPSTICAFTTRWMPSAASSTDRPSGRAMRRSIAARASAGSSATEPPAKYAGIELAEHDRCIGHRRLPRRRGRSRRARARSRPIADRRAARRRRRARRWSRRRRRSRSRRPSARAPESRRCCPPRGSPARRLRPARCRWTCRRCRW